MLNLLAFDQIGLLSADWNLSKTQGGDTSLKKNFEVTKSKKKKHHTLKLSACSELI